MACESSCSVTMSDGRVKS